MIWRIFLVGALVAVLTIAAIVALGVWSRMQYDQRPLEQWFGDGVLGPEVQRQRVETSHGFSISMANDWTAEDPPPDPCLEQRLGMRALLTMRPPTERADCTVYRITARDPDEGPDRGREAG